MSLVGGSFSAGRVFRGGAQALRPSQYYLGFWPCQQADGDSDDERVTDRSGNGAHMGLGALSSTEAWANAGVVTSLSDTNHAPQLALADRPYRYSTDSLIISADQFVTKEGSAIRVAGDANGSSATGMNIVVASTGAMQVHAVGSATSSFSGGMSVTPYSSAVFARWLVAYDAVARTISWAVNGAIAVSGNQSITASHWDTLDANRAYGFCIGGQPASTSKATQARLVHALYFPGKGLPTNLATVAQRLYAHPRLMLRDQDFQF